jgi:hypothetical protein
MDVSDLRKRILRALDDARLDSASKRGERDEAHRAYEQFLENVAVPLLKQAQGILRAEQKLFTVHAPAGGAKLASDTSPETFLEFMLDTTGDRAGVLGRISHARGRRQVVVDERPIAPGKSVAELTDEDVAAFLLAELPRLVGR